MIGTSCTDQPVSKKNRLTFLIFILQGYWLLNSQAPIQASTESDNQVSTDRQAQATKTVSKTCADVRIVQVSLPDVFNSKSASAVGNVSSEAQIIKDVFKEVIDKRDCL